MVRFKHRYLLVHLIFPQTLPNTLDQNPTPQTQPTDGPRPPQLSESGLISLLRESLSANFGDVGAGEVGGAFSSKSDSFNQDQELLRGLPPATNNLALTMLCLSQSSTCHRLLRFSFSASRVNTFAQFGRRSLCCEG